MIGQNTRKDLFLELRLFLINLINSILKNYSHKFY